MKRDLPWSVLLFSTGVLAVVAALSWVSYHALRLERLEREARAQTKHQEAVRLALWRMDAAITPIIAREAARPYFDYQSFIPVGRPVASLRVAPPTGEPLVPSPLLSKPDSLVLLNYQRDDSGLVNSPQAPSGVYRVAAEPTLISGYELDLNDALTSKLAALLESDTSARTLMPQVAMQQAAQQGEHPQQAVQLLDADEQARKEFEERQSYVTRNVTQSQTRAGAGERKAPTLSENAPPSAETPSPARPAEADPARPESRARTSADKRADAHSPDRENLKKDAPPSDAFPTPPPIVASPEVDHGPFEARWLIRPGESPQLVFEREVRLGSERVFQGFWLDWESLRRTLLESSKPLFPDADLRPLLRGVSNEPDVLGRSLASIPAELVCTPAPLLPGPGTTPIRATLAVTWIAALGAVLVIGLVLRASMELAERRGQFVSAVTHELRTPLTTFVMYSQMLADGMIQGEDARRTYLATLKTESQRLARIVESVLEYARLSKRRHAVVRTSLSADALVESLRPVLEQRCAQAGMTLVVDREGDLSTMVQTDPGTLERVLYNLVDNACKYAADADDKRVHLAAKVRAGRLTLGVRDHGPGVAAADHAVVFRPFTRGTRQADGSVPGLGLGLALSRSLVKELGGELWLEPEPGGAHFGISLPPS